MFNKVLFEAVKGRQVGVVSAILKRVDDVDQTDGEGMTALMMASRDGALPIVKLLLKAGASPFAADREGRTALHWTSWSGNALVSEALLEAGAEVNAQNREGQTPLMLMILGRRSEAALRLIKRSELDLAATDRDGRTAVDLAAAGSMPDVLSALMERQRQRRASGGGILGMLHAGGDPVHFDPIHLSRDRYGGNALHHAARLGDLEALALILSASDVNVNERNDAGETPLLAAVRAGAMGCVEKLLSVKADPNRPGKNGETPLCEAARLGRIVIADMLMRAGADVNAALRNGQTPLLLAIRERNVDIVRALLDHGADVHVRDSEGRGALAYATATGLEALTVMMIEAGAES